MSAPSACVVVASRDRAVRLRWLLNALSEQSHAGELEIVVAHDSALPATAELLDDHPLRSRGQLRQLSFASHRSSPAAMRNAAWRSARSSLILFTDDDCRPAAGWVAEAIAASAAHPGAILQGTTLPDPDEAATMIGAPWPHTLHVTPPDVWAPTCNIAYPRELLEAVGGFDEQFPAAAGEDTDLALRAQEKGAQLVPVPAMLTYHAVSGGSLLARLRTIPRWQHIPALVKRHPRLRREITGGVFWKAEHAALAAAATAPLLMRRHRGAALLALPWLRLSMRHRGYGLRGLVRSASELPGHAAIDGAEIAVLIRGSMRHRTVLL